MQPPPLYGPQRWLSCVVDLLGTDFQSLWAKLWVSRWLWVSGNKLSFREILRDDFWVSVGHWVQILNPCTPDQGFPDDYRPLSADSVFLDLSDSSQVRVGGWGWTPSPHGPSKGFWMSVGHCTETHIPLGLRDGSRVLAGHGRWIPSFCGPHWRLPGDVGSLGMNSKSLWASLRVPRWLHITAWRFWILKGLRDDFPHTQCLKTLSNFICHCLPPSSQIWFAHKFFKNGSFWGKF